MSNIEWRSLPGFDKYVISNTGILKRIAYDEEGTNRHMKECIVKPNRTGDTELHVSVRLLTDDKREIFRSLGKLLHDAFPEMDIDTCKQIAVNRYEYITSIPKEDLILPGEIWKDCARYESTIQISTFGRVKRKARQVVRSNGRRYTISEKILKSSDYGRDYKSISINVGDKFVWEAIHRLVAETFIPNPDNLPEVNHKDGNGGNNFVDNLEWVTHKDNARHAWDTGLYKKPHPVTCLETGEEFESVYILADFLELYYATVQNKITCKSPIGGLHYAYTEKLI